MAISSVPVILQDSANQIAHRLSRLNPHPLVCASMPGGDHDLKASRGTKIYEMKIDAH
jgi:hypothetical protein